MEFECICDDIKGGIHAARDSGTGEEQRRVVQGWIRTALTRYDEDWRALRREEWNDDWLDTMDRVIDCYSHLMTDVAEAARDVIGEELNREIWNLASGMIESANILHMMGVEEPYISRADGIASWAAALAQKLPELRETPAAPAGQSSA
jgi:uncharacterized protein YukE